MENFTQEDIKNILALIAQATIKGQEATTVAILQQKLNQALTPKAPTVEEKKDEEKQD